MNTFSSLTSKLTLGVLVLLAPALSFAQATKLAPPVTAIGNDLKDFIDLLVSIMQAVGIPMLVVAIIYSGYLMLSAGGNDEQISKAKTWIIWTLVGAAIILGAQVIADIVFDTAALF